MLSAADTNNTLGVYSPVLLLLICLPSYVTRSSETNSISHTKAYEAGLN